MFAFDLQCMIDNNLNYTSITVTNFFDPWGYETSIKTQSFEIEIITVPNGCLRNNDILSRLSLIQTRTGNILSSIYRERERQLRITEGRSPSPTHNRTSKSTLAKRWSCIVQASGFSLFFFPRLFKLEQRCQFFLAEIKWNVSYFFLAIIIWLKGKTNVEYKWICTYRHTSIW